MSASEPSFSKPSLSLDQLVALNDELQALVRAGIPIERGLIAASGDYRGRLGQAIRELGERLEAGQRLPEAMAASSNALPEVYRAMVEAGLRTGRLAEALQGLSRVGQAAVEARRTIALACFYPFLVLILAYVLFLGFLVEILPRFSAAAESFRFDDSQVVSILERAGRSVWTWGGIVPLALLGMVFVWGLLGRSRVLDGAGGAAALVARFPWVGRIIANYRSANFIDLLAHLIDHEVPLPDAVRLAGDTSGDARLRTSAHAFADRLVAGATPAADEAGSIPPLVAWMLGSGDRQGSLGSGLAHLATAYRRKANRQAEAFRIILPGLLVLVIGSGAVLAYGVLLFIPLRHLWDSLANPLH